MSCCKIAKNLLKSATVYYVVLLILLALATIAELTFSPDMHATCLLHVHVTLAFTA